MSAPGRPKGETGSAKRAGRLMSALAVRAWPRLAATALVALLVACGGGGDGGAGAAGGGPNAQALRAEIDQLFPYVANQPIDVTFVCTRSNSRLTYFFDFDPNQRFTVFFETDTRQQVSFSGSYTHANGALRMVADPNPVLLLDETTTQIVPHLGLLAEFYTPIMRCGATGHGYNNPAGETFKSYGCPNINVGPASREENAVEFNLSASPFPGNFVGSIFRQRDVDVYLSPSLIITRGWGIYRRVGDTFYADFWNQFPDANLLKGTFAGGDAQLSVEQLQPGAGPCNRR